MSKDNLIKEAHNAMNLRINEHLAGEDFIGYHAWNNIDAQDAFYEGYVVACEVRQVNIEELQERLRKAEDLIKLMSRPVKEYTLLIKGYEVHRGIPREQIVQIRDTVNQYLKQLTEQSNNSNVENKGE